jgi:hypothetical protein
MRGKFQEKREVFWKRLCNILIINKYFDRKNTQCSIYSLFNALTGLVIAARIAWSAAAPNVATTSHHLGESQGEALLRKKYLLTSK